MNKEKLENKFRVKSKELSLSLRRAFIDSHHKKKVGSAFRSEKSFSSYLEDCFNSISYPEEIDIKDCFDELKKEHKDSLINNYNIFFEGVN